MCKNKKKVRKILKFTTITAIFGLLAAIMYFQECKEFESEE